MRGVRSGYSSSDCLDSEGHSSLWVCDPPLLLPQHRSPNFLWFSNSLSLAQRAHRTALLHLGGGRVVGRKATLKSGPCLTSAQLWESCAEDPENLLEQLHPCTCSESQYILKSTAPPKNYISTLQKKPYFCGQYDKKAVLFHLSSLLITSSC